MGISFGDWLILSLLKIFKRFLVLLRTLLKIALFLHGQHPTTVCTRCSECIKTVGEGK